MNHAPKNLTILGLLGGVASGKSFVAQSLVRRGAVLLDADRAGHEVLLEPNVEAAARKRWGDGIFGCDGHIHRPTLASIVFAQPPDGPRELAHLEALTHPRINMRLQNQLNHLSQGQRAKIVVLDAPVMLKAGWNSFCSRVVFVDAPRSVRLARALIRGWTQEDFERREAAQESLEIKRSFADEVIDNSGSQDATEAQIEGLWARLIADSLH